eukprot:scaffold222680_cov36-Tisochrysis_lutea.AAC.1
MAVVSSIRDSSSRIDAVETIQAAARGWLTRLEQQQCRSAFASLLAEIEGEEALCHLGWGRYASRPCFSVLEPNNEVQTAEHVQMSHAPNSELSTQSLHAELRELKLALARKRGKRIPDMRSGTLQQLPQ